MKIVIMFSMEAVSILLMKVIHNYQDVKYSTLQNDK